MGRINLHNRFFSNIHFFFSIKKKIKVFFLKSTFIFFPTIFHYEINQNINSNISEKIKKNAFFDL